MRSFQFQAILERFIDAFRHPVIAVGVRIEVDGVDINKQQILDELGEIAPVLTIRGNNDKQWVEYLTHPGVDVDGILRRIGL